MQRTGWIRSLLVRFLARPRWFRVVALSVVAAWTLALAAAVYGVAQEGVGDWINRTQEERTPVLAALGIFMVLTVMVGASICGLFALRRLIEERRWARIARRRARSRA